MPLTTRLHQAARRLLRARAFTTTATLTLMLGIAGTAAVFTVVDGVLLRPLPYDHPEQLVDLSHTLAVSGISSVDQSDATYLAYRRENRVFTDIGAYRSTAVNLRVLPGGSSGDEPVPERASAAVVTPSVFHVLDASARLGRRLREEDGEPGAAPVVVIGTRLWERDFGSDPAIVGRRVMIDGVEREVVGVMPPSFDFPTASTALWVPLVLDPARTASAAFDYRAVARLRDGVTPAAAAADLQRLLPRVPELFPGRLTARSIAATHMRAVVRPLRDVMVGDVGRVLWIVLGAVGVLLLIACANVANLFLARAEGRQRELAVRRALGAGRASLLADFLSEAVLLAALGGALGLACAAVAVHTLQSLGLGASIPRFAEVRVNGVVGIVTACAATLAAVIVSALPVLRAGRTSLSAVLVATSAAASGGRTRSRARRGLVVAQVALALVLLAGAGLFARSFSRLRAVDPGFTAEHALTFRVALPAATHPAAADVARLVAGTLDALRAIPGVRSAGVVTKLPLDPEARQDSAVFLEDQPTPRGGIPDIHQTAFATAGYFSAMGIPLIAGRTFDRLDPGSDPAHAPREVVVSDAFAKRYWHGAAQALGKRVRMTPTDPWSTIVGVVGGVRDEGLERPPAETVYSPVLTLSAAGAPWAPRDLAFVVRTAGDAASLAAAVRSVVRTQDPALPLYRLMPLGELLARAVARTTFTLLLLGIAAVVAMAIGAMGIYGVISYLVSLRTREIGVRLALGAQPADVRRLITRHALADAAIGVAVGLVAAAALTRVLASVLFDVSPTDPATLVVAALLLFATALAASWIPARRAAALDPASALRTD